jgi:maltose/moltooligosaccharide transporter
VDMTDWAHIGTFTGLYYLFSTTAAIIGPIMYGWIVEFSGGNYSLIMLLSPFFFLLALLTIAGVKRGEAHSSS